jgi:predicted acylesterase/phospholipase RssA
MAPVKRILVLSGGGAKGAYAFGCLKAFKKRGVEFDVVSGTSVGALNALLWSTDSLKEGQKIWSELSFETVYPIRLFRTKFLPQLITNSLGALIAPLTIGYNLLSSSWKGQPNPTSSHSSSILVAISYLPYIPFLLFVLYMNYEAGLEWLKPRLRYDPEPQFSTYAVLLLFDLIFVAICLIAVVRRRKEFAESTRDFSGYFKELMFRRFRWILALVLGFCCNALSSKPFLDSVIERVIIVFLIVIPFVISLSIQSVLFLIEAINKKVGTVMDSSPLKSTVDSILANKSFKIITLVCAAVRQERSRVRQRLFESDTDPLEFATFTRWIPIYFDVSNLASDQRTLPCLASAALPFGVVPSVEISDATFVDGGVIDNSPIYPFIDEPEAEIYVVLLEHFKNEKDADQLAKKELETILKTVSEFGPPQIVRSLHVGQRFPSKELFTVSGYPLTEFPILKKVELFYPRKRSLGNFVTGTLNFNPRYARKTMVRGYRETVKKLDKMARRESA